MRSAQIKIEHQQSSLFSNWIFEQKCRSTTTTALDHRMLLLITWLVDGMPPAPRPRNLFADLEYDFDTHP